MFETHFKEATAAIILELYAEKVAVEDINITYTTKDYEGDFTVVLFPLVKVLKKNPETLGNEIGAALKERCVEIEHFSIIKGFLNLSLKPAYWSNTLQNNYTQTASSNRNIVLEYCGPNTNKPLHLGHIRNMFLGYAMANILKAVGNSVKKVNIYNDRGIAICKSMLAWKKFYNEETPSIKGDHFIGDCYVAFDKAYKAEVEELIAAGKTKKEAEQEAPIMQECRAMLLKWEAGDAETVDLWKRHNAIVYKGFQETFDTLGIDFDGANYESQEYEKGKQIVLDGLAQNIFYKKEDGAICADLTSFGLDEKVLLRGDGTSIYLTQDIGIAEQRYKDFKMDEMIYVVANEQDYHFKALKAVLTQLGKPYAKNIYHLSYGMVDLPTGRMKSREGTVVDADDLVSEIVSAARETTLASGKVDDLSEAEQEKLFNIIGIGAIKYFILKVNAKKKMLFNPEESVDLHGDTAPFIQYSYARTQAIKRRVQAENIVISNTENYVINSLEKDLLIHLYKYNTVLVESAESYDPSVLCQYAFQLAKLFNRFYAECKILSADTETERDFRLTLTFKIGEKIKECLSLLGIDVPEKM